MCSCAPSVTIAILTLTLTHALCYPPRCQVLPTRMTIAVIAAGLISHGTEATVVEPGSGAARLGFSHLVNVDYFARFVAMVEGIRAEMMEGTGAATMEKLGPAHIEAALAALQDMDVRENGAAAALPTAKQRKAARKVIAATAADLLARGQGMRSGFMDPALVDRRQVDQAAYLTWLPLHC